MCLVFGQIHTVFIQSMILHHGCGTMLRVIDGLEMLVIRSSYEFFNDVIFGMTHDARP